MRVVVHDVETYWAMAQEIQAHVVEPIGDDDGVRAFTIADPDGFGVQFATPIGAARPQERTCGCGTRAFVLTEHRECAPDARRSRWRCRMRTRRTPANGLSQAVGERLREVRRTRSVSQQAAARVAGLTQGSISNYEHGLRDIAVVDLLTILGELHVSLAEFMAEVPAFLVLEDAGDIGIAKKLITDGLDRPG